MVNSGVSCGEPKRTAPQNRPAPPSPPLSASLESVLNDPIGLGSAGFQMPDFESGARPFPPPQNPAILATTGRWCDIPALLPKVAGSRASASGELMT